MLACIFDLKLRMYQDGEASPCVKLDSVRAQTSSEKYNVSAGTYKIRICAALVASFNHEEGKTYDLSVTYKEIQTFATTEKPNTTASDNKNTVTSLKKSNVTVSSAKSKAKKKVYLNMEEKQICRWL